MLFYAFNFKLIMKFYKFNFYKIFNKIVDNHFVNVNIRKFNNFFFNLLINKVKWNINVLNF